MNVTLKEYFLIKGFGRGDSTPFAEECGVSLSYISRLVHDHGEARVNTPAYNKVAAVLARDGYELMLNPEADYLSKATKMENEQLEHENLELTTSLKEANDKIANLERRIEIMNRVFKHIKIANTMLKKLEED